MSTNKTKQSLYNCITGATSVVFTSGFYENLFVSIVCILCSICLSFVVYLFGHCTVCPCCLKCPVSSIFSHTTENPVKMSYSIANNDVSRVLE